MVCRVDKFTFFISYLQAVECLDNDNDKLAFLLALLKYAFYGELPEFSDKLAGMFELLKPNVDKTVKNIRQGAANGAKGGAPAGNKNAKKKTTPGLNENKTDKDKEMDMEYGEGNNIITIGGKGKAPAGNIDYSKLYI